MSYPVGEGSRFLENLTTNWTLLIPYLVLYVLTISHIHQQMHIARLQTVP